ncbi:type II/IV secretion system protein [Mucilaginibacter sp. ZT4R22]|uniref:Type II/IV secretion system protein n=1 Tax=Mucilaginibacter pankratovii TaxID=2772110 RepID=A0ABR7WNB9_9SPHI|nr:GspE/PulE family protein [Mucilaginibacter pankratovii]MBD1363823.1 type II/IV secretion system protein [Mucilaginibacter pankratovii]
MTAQKEINLQTEHIHLLTREQAWYYKILPAGKRDNALLLYSINDSEELRSELEILLNCPVEVTILPDQEISRLLSTYYIKDDIALSTEKTQAGADPDNFLLNLVREAKNLKSSDIHIESYEHKCRVRIRIDGMMIERYLINREDYPALVNKIKILSNLDIAEKRLPQDGRWGYNYDNLQFDIRVSILPALYGEKIVLRLLNNDAANIGLEKLGLSAFDLNNYMQGARRPNGILLISGPTGSGKTTTLYATLKLLNVESRNILTIEDPVEYTLEGINQVQLKESIGLGFAAALKTFLRQDPDVIMVGEIRDVDTANMAVRAALTGHLVLSTIHTNSAWGTVSRLIDMGVPPFLVASTVNTTVAQRLLRMLCPDCKERKPMSDTYYPKQFRPYSQVDFQFAPKGCSKCYFTGYKGRKAVYEVIAVDRELAAEIKKGEMDVRRLLQERGIKSLAENAFELFHGGQTSLDEIFPLLFNY